MPYTQATAADLKTQLTRFAEVDDTTVEFWLTRARRGVDDSWCEDDRAFGEVLLAAHYMTQEGLGAGAEAQLAADCLAGIKSIRSGQLSIDRGTGGLADETAGTIGSTTYGQRFLALQMQQGIGSPLVAPTGSLPDALLYEPLYYVGTSS